MSSQLENIPAETLFSPMKTTTKDYISTAKLSSQLQQVTVPSAEQEISRFHREAQNLKREKRRKKQEEVKAIIANQTSASFDEEQMNDVETDNEPIVVEQWINQKLQEIGDEVFLIPYIELINDTIGEDQFKRIDEFENEFETQLEELRQKSRGPMMRAGIDRLSLQRLGYPTSLIDRIYRALYVYTSGFHNILREVGQQSASAAARDHLISNIWGTFLYLLENCQESKYEMAMANVTQATKKWRKTMLRERKKEMEQHNSSIAEMKKMTHDARSELEKEHRMSKELRRILQSKDDEIIEYRSDIIFRDEEIEQFKVQVTKQENEITQLTQDLEKRKLQFHASEAKLSSANQELDEQERKFAAVKQAMEKERMQINVGKETLREVTIEKQKLDALYRRSADDYLVLAKDHEILTREKKTLQKSLNMGKILQHTLRIRNNKLDDEIKELKYEVETTLDSLEAVNKQLEKSKLVNTELIISKNRSESLIRQYEAEIKVLEAQLKMISNEKLIRGQRANDKARFERLHQKKQDVEKELEKTKLDMAKLEDQLWMTKAQVESLNRDLLNTKKTLLSSQQQYVQSERTNEQLNQQLKEAEKANDRMSKSFTSFKAHARQLEVYSKDQINKLEMEIRVLNSQLKEICSAHTQLEAQLRTSKEDTDHVSKDKHKLLMRVNYLEKQIATAKVDKDGLVKESASLTQKNKHLRRVINRYIQDVEKLAGEIEENKIDVQDALIRMEEKTVALGGEVLEDESSSTSTDKGGKDQTTATLRWQLSAKLAAQKRHAEELKQSAIAEINNSKKVNTRVSVEFTQLLMERDASVQELEFSLRERNYVIKRLENTVDALKSRNRMRMETIQMQGEDLIVSKCDAQQAETLLKQTCELLHESFVSIRAIQARINARNGQFVARCETALMKVADRESSIVHDFYRGIRNGVQMRNVPVQATVTIASVWTQIQVNDRKSMLRKKYSSRYDEDVMSNTSHTGPSEAYISFPMNKQPSMNVLQHSDITPAAFSQPSSSSAAKLHTMIGPNTTHQQYTYQGEKHGSHILRSSQFVPPGGKNPDPTSVSPNRTRPHASSFSVPSTTLESPQQQTHTAKNNVETTIKPHEKHVGFAENVLDPRDGDQEGQISSIGTSTADLETPSDSQTSEVDQAEPRKESASSFHLDEKQRPHDDVNVPSNDVKSRRDERKNRTRAPVPNSSHEISVGKNSSAEHQPKIILSPSKGSKGEEGTYPSPSRPPRGSVRAPFRQNMLSGHAPTAQVSTAKPTLEAMKEEFERLQEDSLVFMDDDEEEGKELQRKMASKIRSGFQANRSMQVFFDASRLSRAQGGKRKDQNVPTGPYSPSVIRASRTLSNAAREDMKGTVKVANTTFSSPSKIGHLAAANRQVLMKEGISNALVTGAGSNGTKGKDVDMSTNVDGVGGQDPAAHARRNSSLQQCVGLQQAIDSDQFQRRKKSIWRDVGEKEKKSKVANGDIKSLEHLSKEIPAVLYPLFPDLSRR